MSLTPEFSTRTAHRLSQGIGLLVALATVLWSPGQATAATVDYTKPNYTNSPPLRKFVDSLPGLGYANRNNLNQYIPVAIADTTTYPGSDYYEIGLFDYTQPMHSDLPATRLRGYRDLNPAADGQNHYLGPLIVAQRDRPVRVKFINSLATGAAGNLFIPVDSTVMGAGAGPVMGENYKQNRAGLHLHGGFPPWISDGTAHQWTVPTGEVTSYKKGLSTKDVPDMPPSGDGAMTFFYPNQQSGRLMFYHDHAYGITRLNVYAGEAAGYLLVDPVELGLVSAGTVPADQIPLIIQDKTFVPDPATVAATDPLWDLVNWGGQGSLWFPHVYQPNQDPTAANGVNPLGRWDYGALVAPPVTTTGPLPDISIVPEAFMDTPVVNGTAYPYVTVQPKAYRLRVLNACNDRMLNLQLYYAQGNAADPDGIHRASGEADLTRPGPAFYQIGNEGGLLPATAVLNNPPQQIGYDADTRSATFGNVNRYTLLLGPAERADLIIDFSGVAPGSKLILYNDAPAPLPMADIRYDYYTGDPDMTMFGGAPTTLAGYGPNTRTLMQIRVEGTPATAFSTAGLDAALASAFAATQPPPLVPAGIYGNNTMLNTAAPPQTLGGIPIKLKTLTEAFDNLGRMNALLGDTTVGPNNQNHTTFGLAFTAPPTEIIPAGTSEVWGIMHGGVDTHVIHWHLLNVQVINRVDAAGVVSPPDPNERGWKESLRFNPFESVFVAVRPSAPIVPFRVPTSVRPLDVTMPSTGVLGSVYNAVTNPNPLTDFGHEFVWHCHLLGHEENDMMRPLIMRMNALTAASALSATVVGASQINLAWTDNSPDEAGFRVERALVTAGVAGPFSAVGTVAANVVALSDTTAVLGSVYRYRVFAFSSVGESAASNVVTVGVGGPTAPSTLVATAMGTKTKPRVGLTWRDMSNNETVFVIQRATNSAFTRGLRTVTVGPNVTTYSDAVVKSKTKYYYRVNATNAIGPSAFSNTATVTTK